jgi:hypothetical protein
VSPFAFQTYDDDKARNDRTLARTYTGTLERHAVTLAAANMQRCAVRVTINDCGDKPRRAANVMRVRKHFVEIDGTMSLSDIIGLREQCELPPAWINESSPGHFHVYWNVADDVANDLEGFTQRQKKLAKLFKAACDYWLPQMTDDERTRCAHLRFVFRVKTQWKGGCLNANAPPVNTHNSEKPTTCRGHAKMPNHVTTRCTVIGPSNEVDIFRARMIVTTADKTGKLFDFNKIIPAPAILDQVEESTVSEFGARLIVLRAERRHPFYTGRMYDFEEESAPSEYGPPLPEQATPYETMGMSAADIPLFRGDLGMPDAPFGEVAAAYLAKYPEYETAGRLRLQATLETGFAGWYSWNIANWGTKWNSYSSVLLAITRSNFCLRRPWIFPSQFLLRLCANTPLCSSSV